MIIAVNKTLSASTEHTYINRWSWCAILILSKEQGHFHFASNIKKNRDGGIVHSNDALLLREYFRWNEKIRQQPGVVTATLYKV